MLGQPVSMLIPRVVGFKLYGELPAGTTATDLVLTITEMLRQHGVVGKFVEFYGEGVTGVSLANRATIGNMSPEYGSTVAIFPIDDETLNYLRLTGRPDEQIRLVEAYAKAQGCGTIRRTSRRTRSRWNSTWAPCSLRWPGRSGRRTGAPGRGRVGLRPRRCPPHTDAPAPPLTCRSTARPRASATVRW